jgi:hypothetical protein
MRVWKFDHNFGKGPSCTNIEIWTGFKSIAQILTIEHYIQKVLSTNIRILTQYSKSPAKYIQMLKFGHNIRKVQSTNIDIRTFKSKSSNSKCSNSDTIFEKS